MVSEVRVVVRSGRMVTGTGQKRDFWAQIISHPWSGVPYMNLFTLLPFVRLNTQCVLFSAGLLYIYGSKNRHG